MKKISKLPTTAMLATSVAKALGFKKNENKLVLKPVKRNEARRDFAFKSLFTVSVSDTIKYLVLVGDKLGDLKKRTDQFVKYHSKIAVPCVGFGKCGKWSFIVSEYFDGISLEAAVKNGAIDDNRAKNIVSILYNIVHENSIVSNLSALENELLKVFTSLKFCSYLNHFDLEILEQRIYPIIQKDLCKGPFRKIMTNGDFTGSNILVDKNGNFRLIDYEFAGLTHFDWEDAIRWKSFSNFESKSLLPTIFDNLDNITLPKEILFILKQLILEDKLIGLGINSSKIQRYLFRLKQIMGNLDVGLQGSMFWNEKSNIPRLSKSDSTVAQIFWTWDDSFSEVNSIRKPITMDEWVKVEGNIKVVESKSLRLRFDLCETQGLIEIQSLRLIGSNGEYLFKGGAKIGWNGINNEKHAWCISSKENYFIFSLGIDPIIYLSKIDAKKLKGLNSLIWVVEYKIHSDMSLVREILEENVLLQEHFELEFSRKKEVLLVKEIKNIQELLNDSENQRQSIKKSHSNSLKENNEVNAKLVKSNMQLDYSERTIIKLEESIAKLEENLKKTKLSEASLSVKLNLLNKELAQEEQNKNKLFHTIDILREELNKINDKSNRQEISLKNTKDLLNAQKLKINTIEKEKRNLKNTITSQTSLNDELNREINSLRSKKESLETGIKDLNQCLSESEQQVASLDRELNELLSGEIVELNSEKRSLESTIQNLQQRLSASESELSQTRLDFDRLEKYMYETDKSWKELFHSQIIKVEEFEKVNQLNLDQITAEKNNLQRSLDFVLSHTGKKGSNAFAVSQGRNYKPTLFDKLIGRNIEVPETDITKYRSITDKPLKTSNQEPCSEKVPQVISWQDTKIRQQIVDSGLFIPDWYLHKYSEITKNKDPLSHYIEKGGREGKSPSPYFDSRWYLEQNPDVGKSGLNPLIHFIRYGSKEGRNPNEYFNGKWYLNKYNLYDVSLGKAISHFATIGDRESYSPSSKFEAEWYLSENQDVKLAGIPPFYHYVSFGKMEGRLPREIDASTIRNIEGVEVKYFEGVGNTNKDNIEKINLLLVTHSSGHSLFGAERSFLDVVESLDSTLFNIYVVIPHPNIVYIRKLRRASQCVVLFPYLQWRDGNLIDKTTIEIFGSLINEFSINILYGNTIMLREPFIAAKNSKVYSILHSREIIDKDKQLLEIMGVSSNEIVESIKAKAELIIGNSKATLKAFKGSNVALLYNTVDSKEYKSFERERGQKFYVGIISSNLEKKGLRDFYELAVLSKDILPNVVFRIIGPETKLLKKLLSRNVTENSNINIEFCGYFENPIQALRIVDVVVNFSWFAESFGRTIAEAMMTEAPVIVYNHGALPELVEHGKNGYIIPYRDYSAAIDFIKMLSLDNELVDRLGKNGRQKAKKLFDKPVFHQNINSIFKKIGDSKVVTDRMTFKSNYNQINIAYFIWHFPVPSETFVLNELRYLRTNDYNVIVFCKQSPHKNFIPDFDIYWERVTDYSDLANKAKKHKIDIFHSHFIYPTVTEMLMPAAEKANIPFTCIAHSQDIFKYENIKVNRIQEISKSVLCAKIFVPGNFHKEYLVKQGVPLSKMAINPNGIDPDNKSFDSSFSRYSRPVKNICAIHRMVEKKGLIYIVEAANELSVLGITINLYGYGPLEDELRNRAKELNVKNLNFCGSVDNRTEIAQVFREHDLFLAPCVRAKNGDMDGIPTVLMDAMSSGLPVASTGISSINDLVVDNVTGIIIEESSSKGVVLAVKRFVSMTNTKRESIAIAARKLIESEFSTNRLTKWMTRVWLDKKFDIILVTWNNLSEVKEVIRRIILYTSFPYQITIYDNKSDSGCIDYFESLVKKYTFIKLIKSDSNTMVGPGTNVSLENCCSEYAIYICSKEGFVLKSNWEKCLINFMDENPDVGLGGTLCYNPSRLRGLEFARNNPEFKKFRNQDFAMQNQNKEFLHVQGGLFIIRRKMYEEIGGFSNTIPHNGTDVEYSYYAESMGWKLGQIPEMISIYNKSRPGLLSRVNEMTKVVHPGDKNVVAQLELINQGATHCNVCEETGKGFREIDGMDCCNHCGASSSTRSLWRYLTESTLTYRRLPAIGVGLQDIAIQRFWDSQFQGQNYTNAEINALIENGSAFSFNKNSIALVYLNGCIRNERDFDNKLLSMVRSILSTNGLLVLRQDYGPELAVESKDMLISIVNNASFKYVDELLYFSSSIKFDYVGLTVFKNQ